VVVPDVVGQPEARAAKTLEEKGLRVKEKRKRSRAQSKGLVIATQPPAGREIERHSVVTLVVSAGPKVVTVPSVVGEQQDAAEAALRGAGLDPVVERRDSDAPDGQVIAQDPGGGSRVKAHSEVIVVVSKGPAAAVVPNVVGESEDAAKADIEGAGLNARVVRRTTSEESEDGQVLDQSPSAGTRLPRGEAVTIFVGKFKAPPTTTTTTTTTPTTTTPTTTTP
jgi:beta-lactam-binding protein with PASTA domain